MPLILDHDAVASDGTIVHVRVAGPADRRALLSIHEQSSDQSLYLRFFGSSRTIADRYLRTLLRPAGPDHLVLLAYVDGSPVGVAAYERTSGDSAELALLIVDAHQHEGIGTLLIEDLAAAARGAGLLRMTADVLAVNGPMLRALRDLGLPCTTHTAAGVTEVNLELTPTADLLRAMDLRERTADIASLRRLIEPRSIVVVGAGTRDRSVGHQVLANLIDSGFRGTLGVVNPHHTSVLGIASVASADLLPEVVDLAIIAVPAASVISAIRDCGRRGIAAAIVLSSGFGELGEHGRRMQDELLAEARCHGMRLVGPNCLGVLNTDPAVRMNATFAPLPLQSGGLALVSQSGALGIAVVLAAQRRGLGLSQFVSTGNKLDISGNDLLMWWEQDTRTRVIGLYLESFGNPRKFSRIARRVSRTKPIIAIKAGRSDAGRRAGQSHTAAAASSDAVTDALFRQAGVIRVDTTEQLLDAARVLDAQPLPSGPRIGIIGNSGGPAILAADAASAAGLSVVELSGRVRAAIGAAVTSAASTQNPVDLGAAVQPHQVAIAVQEMLRAGNIDAVLAVFTETLAADRGQIHQALAGAAASTPGKPLVLTQVGEDDFLIPAAGPAAGGIPVFGFPEPAVAALATAWEYARLQAHPHTAVLRPADLDRQAARALVSQPGWLPAEQAERLLRCYGIRSVAQRVAPDGDTVAAVAQALGFPVALKRLDGDVHKTDRGGVLLDLRDAEQARAGYRRLWPAEQGPVLVQAMAAPGTTELIVGAVQEAQFGPVIMVGPGGVLADLMDDRSFRLAPLAASDAQEMLADLRSARLLDGYRGRAAVSRDALADLLVRLGTLVDDLPEVVEVDLNPVMANGDQLLVVDAKIRVTVAAARPDEARRSLSQRPVAGTFAPVSSPSTLVD